VNNTDERDFAEERYNGRTMNDPAEWPADETDANGEHVYRDANGERVEKREQGHTPGPWAMSDDGVPEAFRPQITVYAESDGRRVATVFDRRAAELMIAAPELLSALKNMLRYLEAGPISTKSDRRWCVLEIERALALAEGQS